MVFPEVEVEVEVIFTIRQWRLYSWTALTFDIKFIVHAVNYIDLEDDLKDDLIVQLMYKSGVSLIFVTKL